MKGFRHNDGRIPRISSYTLGILILFAPATDVAPPNGSPGVGGLRCEELFGGTIPGHGPSLNALGEISQVPDPGRWFLRMNAQRENQTAVLLRSQGGVVRVRWNLGSLERPQSKLDEKLLDKAKLLAGVSVAAILFKIQCAVVTELG